VEVEKWSLEGIFCPPKRGGKRYIREKSSSLTSRRKKTARSTGTMGKIREKGGVRRGQNWVIGRDYRSGKGCGVWGVFRLQGGRGRRGAVFAAHVVRGGGNGGGRRERDDPGS